MNIDSLIDQIIPKSDYEHRNGFNNEPILDDLTDDEKQLLINALVQKLDSDSTNEIDILIVDTLAYLKASASLPTLKKFLETIVDPITKLSIASAIFQIDQEDQMIDIALSVVNQLDDKKDAYYVYKLISAFYYLAKFNTEKTNKILREYSTHSEYLISYNAKRSLNEK